MDETEGNAPDATPEGETGETSSGEGPAEGEEPTQVAGPSKKEASTEAENSAAGASTKPAAAAAGGTPPAAPPQQPRPTLSMAQPKRNSSWILWLLIIVVALLLAALAAWFFLTRGEETAPVASPSPSPVAWTGAWGRIDGVAGGLVIGGSAGAYDVIFYDGALRPGESVPATQSADGRQLQFTMPSQFSFGGGPSGPFEATLTLGDTPDMATLSIVGADQTSISMPLRRVAELVPTDAEGSPSPSASAPAAESPSALESPSAP